MIKNAASPTSVGALNEMELLRKRYEDLSRKKTACEINLDNARNALQDLQAQAREQYQTDDLEALQTRLEDMRAENQRLQDEYRTSLDAIETSLKEVDQAYQAES
jgi:predicted  nucleic acid-binding Zn-ribbon protein